MVSIVMTISASGECYKGRGRRGVYKALCAARDRYRVHTVKGTRATDISYLLSLNPRKQRWNKINK